jgi:hypothetical protein
MGCSFAKLSQLTEYQTFYRESVPSEVAEGWSSAYDHLKREDENMHREFREEIDTLLVFVSAISYEPCFLPNLASS